MTLGDSSGFVCGTGYVAVDRRIIGSAPRVHVDLIVGSLAACMASAASGRRLFLLAEVACGRFRLDTADKLPILRLVGGKVGGTNPHPSTTLSGSALPQY